jgi:DNA repair protein RecO (recombination protein O)
MKTSMGLLKTEAIILRTFDYSETSQIVWFFTRNHGRLHAIAKGSRRSRSEFEGALEPFVHCEIEFYRKEKRELDILGSIELKDIRLDLRNSIERITYASYLTELIAETIQIDDPNPEFFQDTCRTFQKISSGPLEDLAKVSFAFEGQFLRALGLYPLLDRCIDCQKVVDMKSIPFNPGKGGVLCEDHGKNSDRVIRKTLTLFERLVAGEAPKSIDMDHPTTRELRCLLNDYWQHQLEKELKLRRAVWDLVK